MYSYTHAHGPNCFILYREFVLSHADGTCDRLTLVQAAACSKASSAPSVESMFWERRALLIFIYKHTHEHTEMHMHTHTQMHTCIRTQRDAQAHTQKCTHAHAHTHAHTYTCTHTDTEIHMHTHIKKCCKFSYIAGYMWNGLPRDAQRLAGIEVAWS